MSPTHAGGYMGVYGCVTIEKSYCLECNGFFIVKNGILQCCDKRVFARPEKWKRESLATGERARPSMVYQKEQLHLQGHRCLYCEKVFGFKVQHKRKVVTLRVHWDHFIPYAYLQASPDRNFVAACQICNSLKSAKYFQTLEEVRLYVATARSKYESD